MTKRRIRGRVITIIALAIIAAFILTMFMPTMAQAKICKRNKKEVALLDPAETYHVVDKQEGSTYIRSVGNSLFVAITLEDEDGNRLHVKAEKLDSGTYEEPGLLEVIKEGALNEDTRTFDSMVLMVVGDEIHYDDQNMIVVIE